MPHPTDIHVGRKIREVRTDRGLSQDQLASRLGISFQQVQKYEKGTNRIGSSRLWEICMILDVPVGDLFEGLNGKKGNVEPPSLKSIEVARELDAIPDTDVRQGIAKLIRAIHDDFDSGAGSL